jgi:prepilin-type N-terminal cleavage/methylation domain
MKKMNKKGFTLIELLAVIVILAIIALIATPIIIGVIDKARKNSAEDAAYGVIDAAKLAYVESQLDPTPMAASTYSVTTLSVSGTKPTAGTFTIAADGQITVSGLVISGYTCTTSGDKVTCSK